MPGTRKLGRKTDHRLAMLKGMVTYLFEVGQIETTYTRAKEISALAEKMITIGKANNLAAKKKAFAFLKKETVVYKLFSEIAPLYADVNGGYTAVYKLGPRRGDGAEMAVIKLLNADSIYKVVVEDEKAAKKKDKKEAKEEKKED